MYDYTDLLSPLPLNRQQMLDEIARWSIAKVFYHRSSVLLHSERVGIMVDDISPLAEKCLPGYDAKKAGILARVHDDHEQVKSVGDVQACHKALMTPAQKKRLEAKEVAAIQKLAKEFPGNIDGYNYGKLLFCGYAKDCAVSQVVKWCDKLESFCEALHEVLAGNISVLPNLLMDVVVLDRFTEKYPLVAPLLKNAKHPLLNFEFRVTKLFGGEAKPHSKRSITRKTNFPFYCHWKKLIVNHLGQKGIDYLVRQKEFFS